MFSRSLDKRWSVQKVGKNQGMHSLVQYADRVGGGVLLCKDREDQIVGGFITTSLRYNSG